MTRGRNARVGEERQAKNGYWYVKTGDGWRLKHHVIAEQNLGRRLRKNERVSFLDADRENLDPENIHVAVKKYDSSARIKFLESKIRQYQEELDELRRKR